MAEYIERRTAIEHLNVWCGGCGSAVECILAEPAADVAPVVRCKNCKWFADNNDGEWYGCQMFHVALITPEDAPKPNDFCSYGEGKDGGADNA